MIVDANGNVMARRPQHSGEGLVTATVELPTAAVPSASIPDRFWIPEEMPDDWKASWERWLDSGADYYEMVTRRYLETGVITEYIPEYLR